MYKMLCKKTQPKGKYRRKSWGGGYFFDSPCILLWLDTFPREIFIFLFILEIMTLFPVTGSLLIMKQMLSLIEDLAGGQP